MAPGPPKATKTFLTRYHIGRASPQSAEKYGIVTMCIGGMSTAGIYKMLEHANPRGYSEGKERKNRAPGEVI